MDSNKRIPILLVDDEPDVVRALSQLLRRRYLVHTAGSGSEGLEVMMREPSIAVVVSDMNMAGMNGAQFLAQVRIAAPEMVRVLLTGQSNLDAAIAAVNEGQIFRFLSKPCPPPLLFIAVEAAAEQHRLVISERVLFEETLGGSVRALTDLLALASPMAFGRAIRVRRCALQLGEALGIKSRWQLELAASFSQLGAIALPDNLIEKVHRKLPLSEPETALVAKSRSIAETLLAPIPRLDAVREIIAAASRPLPPPDLSAAPPDQRTEAITRSANVLRLAIELELSDFPGADRQDPLVLEALMKIRAAPREPGGDFLLAALEPGMVVAEDVKLTNGAILATRGYEISDVFRERAHSFGPGEVREPIKVQGRPARG